MTTKVLSVRLPEGLHALISKTAAEDHRSINGEIVWLIEAGLAARVKGQQR